MSQRELKNAFRYSLKPHLQLRKQFGLPDATEQLYLFKLRLYEHFILPVSQREVKNAFRYCGAPWVRKFGKLSNRENLVMT